MNTSVSKELQPVLILFAICSFYRYLLSLLKYSLPFLPWHFCQMSLHCYDPLWWSVAISQTYLNTSAFSSRAWNSDLQIFRFINQSRTFIDVQSIQSFLCPAEQSIWQLCSCLQQLFPATKLFFKSLSTCANTLKARQKSTMRWTMTCVWGCTDISNYSGALHIFHSNLWDHHFPYNNFP